VKLMGLLLCTMIAANDGCDITAKTEKKPSDISAGLVPKRTLCSADHRFERTEVYPIGLRADIALDSCTGQLCKTWTWTAKAPNSAWAVYENLPVCASLPATR
jgi:hypothetical protein